MIPIPRLASRFPYVRLVAVGIVVLVVAIASTGCELDELMAGLGADVKEAYDVDVNDPSQVVGAAVSARTMGDSDKADGLDVLRGLRRADYHQKGDRLFNEKDYTGAINQYEEALRWNEPPPPDNKGGGVLGTILGVVGAVAGGGDPERSAVLHGRMGDSYKALGDEENARRSFKQAGQRYEEAAAAPVITKEERESRMRNAAVGYHNSGDVEKACAMARTAGWKDFEAARCP